jgi:glyoxylase-like metal-dependent hydrolase (beta-lactamase superfamily II)
MLPPGAGRRDFCRTVLTAAGALAVTSARWPSRAVAQAPPSPAAPPTPAPLTVTRLGDTLIEISGGGSNVVAITSADGVALIDGGLPDRAADILSKVAAETGNKPIKLLVNTHWHLDHTGANEAVGRAGGQIMATDNTRRWLSSKVFVEAQNRTYEPRPKEAVPTKTFTTAGSMTFGTTRIEYGPLPPAHTNGDMYVFFPAANVLMVSDCLAVGRYPVMDYSTGGWIGGMIDADAALLKIGDASTRIVPGAGPLQTKADLQAQHDMLQAVKDRVQAAIRAGKDLPQLVAESPTKEFDARWGKPDLFLSMAYTGMKQHTP